MTDEDRRVWKILKAAKPKDCQITSEDESSSDDEKISYSGFVNNFLKYKSSFKRFKVSPEEVFNILRHRNMLQEIINP